MDKIIEKKKGIARAFTLKALPYWLGSAVAVLLIVLLARSSNGAMRIDSDTLTIARFVTDDYGVQTTNNSEGYAMLPINFLSKLISSIKEAQAIANQALAK